MTPRLTRFFRRRSRASLALATVALSATALTGTATASPASGELGLSLKPGGKSSLLKQGVKVSYSAKTGKTGATKRAARKQGKKAGAGQNVSMPVVDLDLTAATIRTGGSLAFSLKGQRATLTAIELQVGKSTTSISAKLDKERLVFFRAKGEPAIGLSSITLDKAALSLTGAGADALRDELGLERLAADRTGSATVAAKLPPASPTPAQPSPAGPEKTAPTAPADPYAATCNVPGSGGGNGPGLVAGIAPAPSFDVDQGATGTAIEWGFKQDFRDYVVNFDTPGSLPALDGAVAHPAGAGMSAAGSFFEFPLASGTYEAGSQPNGAGDKLVADGTGTMLFCKPGHGFDIIFKNPTVTIDGADSRITADVGANVNGAWHEFQRADIAELDLTGITPQVSDSGRKVTWTNVPATLSADGALASALPYPAGEPLDPITVKTTVNRPLLSECSIDAGTATPGPVTLTQAALPTLTSPVIGSGGTINWGFRRATRATNASAGNHFDLLGGASEGFPGNMGGGTSGNPGPGLGKFFRFPIASYAYDAGTASATDDKLIATSNATVGFCNLAQGSFGIVISKPTLIVNGASSRIVANAYGYRGAMGWTGGRVDLVNLDASAVNAVATSDTVTWGDVTADNVLLNNGIPVVGALQTDALSVAALTPGGTAAGWDPVAAQIELP